MVNAAISSAASEAQEECWVHLHIQLDRSNEDERRLSDLISALPQGMKTTFCKMVLVDAVPEEDDDIDLLLARFIREMKLRAKPRGKPSHKKRRVAAPAPSRPAVAPAPVAAEPVAASASAPAAEHQDGKQEKSEEVQLGGFEAIAGGSKW